MFGNCKRALFLKLHRPVAHELLKTKVVELKTSSSGDAVCTSNYEPFNAQASPQVVVKRKLINAQRKIGSSNRVSSYTAAFVQALA